MIVAAMNVFMIYNGKLGIKLFNQEQPLTWATLVAVNIVFFYSLLYGLGSMVRLVYIAKRKSVGSWD